MDNLKHYKKREFISELINLENLEDLKKPYKKLMDFVIDNEKDFEQWLLKRSELEAAIDEKRSVLHINMTCNTADELHAKAYASFIENVAPELKKLSKDLDQKFITAVKKNANLNQNRYALLHKKKQAELDLFRSENIDLQTKESLLSQEYQKICGAMTVEFNGEELTLQMMSKYLLETDREVRKDSWKRISSRRLKDYLALDSIFDQMMIIRQEIARNADCTNFTEYQFKNYQRFDYLSSDCKNFHASIFETVVPLYKELLERRKQRMGVDVLYPWDLRVDVDGKDPLRPFDNVDELADKVGLIFEKMDKDLGSFFKQNKDLKLLDLKSRIGKAPGGYQSTLSEARKPFVFMNAVGLDQDVRTLLHESGHAFHVNLAASENILDYREPPIEFCEVASMSMELFGSSYLDTIYNADDQHRSIQKHLEDIVFILPWVATIDSFQHWLYENPDHSADERADKWVAIYKKYNTDVVCWDGYEKELSYLWHRQLHIFEYPFYYIEYAIAQLGALQMWLMFREDKEKALIFYKKALSLGGSRSLPELFKSANIKFDFSKDTITPLITAVKEELKL